MQEELDQIELLNKNEKIKMPDGSLILNEEDLTTLKSFLKEAKELKLLYRGSRDEFREEVSYKKTENIPNNLYLFKTEH